MKVQACPPSSVAGTTKLFLHNWENLTSDRAVLQNVSGVRLEFDSKPVQNSLPRPYVCSKEQSNVIDKEVNELLEKGVVVQVEDSDDIFVSNIFLRPKPGNKWRMIIDLSDLNQFVSKHHFKMDNLDVATSMLFPDAWMASIDLREAYYAIPIHPDDMKYLCFQWKGKYFMFTCLPFGLSSAPLLFTKTLKPIFSEFRKQGFQGFGYIDDTFIVAQSVGECEEAVQFLVDLFSSLGFRVHPEKSVLTPTKQLVFLGYVLNSQEMSVTPTEDKVQKVLAMIKNLQSKRNPKIREVASVIGTLNDLCKGSQYGHAHVKSLEIQKNRALTNAGSSGFEAKMTLNKYCQAELQWWVDSVPSSKKQIRISPPHLILETDASSKGWGANFCQNSTGGRWSQQESEMHINALELQAVFLGLKSLCKDVRSDGIKVKSDNTTTVAYLCHGGGTKSVVCNKIAKDIWQWCEERQIWLLVSHIPGSQNVIADYESRHFTEDTEWKLSQSIFTKITDLWGYPHIDLFASRHNNQVSPYASWGPDPGATFMDAFSENWSQFNFVYIFPPFRLLNRVLQKVRVEHVRAIVIAPDWPGQPWFSPLIQNAKELIRFPRQKGNLTRDNSHIDQDRSLEDIPIMALLLY